MRNLLQLVIVVSCLIFGMSSADAQIAQGNLMLGAYTGANLSGNEGGQSVGLHFTKQKVKDDDNDLDVSSSVGINLNPKVGYCVTDNIVVGAELGIGFSSMQYESNDNEVKFTTFSIGPFLRYYFNTAGFAPFVEANVGFGSGNSESTFASVTTEYKTSSLMWGIHAGGSYFVSNTAALDMSIGYGSTSVKAKENNDNNSRNINSGVMVNVGASMFF